MDKLRGYTKIFIYLVIIVIAVYDMWVFYEGGTQVTVSQTLLEWSYKYPAFTFAMGFICGHLFWRVRDSELTKKLGRE